MSLRDDAVPLTHMLKSAREAVAMARGRRRVDLETDRMLELSLTRLVEVIGEASGRVSEETRKEIPTIPWRDIVGMRNRLIHGYDNVDLDILWDTVEVDLPPLITELEKVLPDQ
jgi:uncharacterized protein with HEPN domain